MFTAWGTRTVVDRAGVAGAAAYDRVRFGEGGGAYLFALQERAAAGYWFVSSLYALPGNADMEEPVFLGDADGAPAAWRCVRRCSRWRPAGGPGWSVPGRCGPRRRRMRRVDLAVRTYTPIKYEYAGEHLWRRRAAAADRAPGVGDALGDSALESFGSVYPPEIYVGDMLWLDRTWQLGPAAAQRRWPFGWRP